MNALTHYYNRRAREYEEIYRRDDPVRQREQTTIAGAMRAALSGRRVLEVACGTGSWTAIVAEAAQQVVATDISPEMLAMVRSKRLNADKVQLFEADAYALGTVPGTFDAGMASFWFSHIPKARMDEFLCGFHTRLGNGAVVFMADNVYVPGTGGALVTRPGSEDTFKLRALSNGSQHEVLKNYYDAGQLRRILTPHCRDLRVDLGQCFWWLRYVVA